MARPKKVTPPIDPENPPMPVVLTARQIASAEKKRLEKEAAERLQALAQLIAPFADSEGFISLYKYDHTTGEVFIDENLNVHLATVSQELFIAVEDFKHTQEKAMEAKRAALDLFLADPETLRLLEEKGFRTMSQVNTGLTISHEPPTE